MDSGAPAASNIDTKTSAASTDLQNVESAAVGDVRPPSNNLGPATGSLAEISLSSTVSLSKPVTAAAGGMMAPKLQMLKASPAVAASQPLATSSEAGTPSTFSRDNIVRNLQEMVKPAAPIPDVSVAAEDVELNDKEKSALEFAISMYMAANEFYDGGSLWCRQCDSIFTDISALCRHIHSDRHQLVSFLLLQNNES